MFCWLACLTVCAEDVPQPLVGTWAIDATLSAAQPDMTAADEPDIRAASHLATLQVSTNSLSIVAPYPEMRIAITNELQCVNTGAAPTRAIFSADLRNGKTLDIEMSLLTSGVVRITKSSAPTPLAQFIWTKEPSNQAPHSTTGSRAGGSPGSP